MLIWQGSMPMEVEQKKTLKMPAEFWGRRANGGYGIIKPKVVSYKE